MDDMKKLVEKYKRELMEYSQKSALGSKPEKLSFPEMLPEETAKPSASAETADSAETVQAAEPSEPTEPTQPAQPIKPRIIGYSDDQRALNDLEKYFSDIISNSSENPGTDESTVSSESNESYESPKSSKSSEPPEQTSRPEGVQTDDFNSLPPQFTDDPPQLDVTNEAVSPENNIITQDNEPEQPSQFPRGGENTTAEPRTIENIGTLPVSGQSPDEQLGRRTFVDQQGAVNSRDDIKPLVQEENDGYPKFPGEKQYDRLEDFLAVNTRQGTLRFRTYTARNALPVPNARVVVFKIIGGKPHTFYELVTDQSGQTEEVPLPAPSSELSQKPDSGVQPYSLYDADITASGYAPVNIRNLPVFEGILSVQRTALVPSVESEGETITENEPNLTEVPDNA